MRVMIPALTAVTLSTAVTIVASVAARTTSPAGTADVSPQQARTIFYDLLKERTDAVENNRYEKIEPLYAHDENLLVLRHEVVMHGWHAVEAYWKRSLSRPPRKEPFRVHWNDDLSVVVRGDLIVGGLTWSNQLGQQPPHYGCLSLALQRHGDRWVIVHEHSSNWTKPAVSAN
jgi:ketosteroid isomerase-like protein